MKNVLITGASSGIGRVFAQVLANRGMNLVLVARSEDKLRSLADELSTRYGVKTWVLPQDLTVPDAAVTVAETIRSWGISIDWLINNAGFGQYGAFTEGPRDRQLAMIQLNVTALVDLTYQFLPDMRKRQSGAIVNVSSIAGFQPLPYMATYAATKAFVLSFSEALWAENHQHGIRIVALCPGPTETEFFREAKFPDSFGERSPQTLADPQQIVEDALKAIESDTPTVVSGGAFNQVIANVPRFLPRPALVSLVEKQFRPS